MSRVQCLQDGIFYKYVSTPVLRASLADWPIDFGNMALLGSLGCSLDPHGFLAERLL